MQITYQETKTFTPAALERLFLSVQWESGRFPEKLARAMQNSTHVISAWDGDTLIGLVRVLSDGETVAFLHYLLVDPVYQGLHIGDALVQRALQKLDSLLYVKVMPSDPKTMPFYARYGFQQHDNFSAMVMRRF